MENVSIAEAKEHLEDLVARAARGEDVRIYDPKAGTVRLTAVAGAKANAPRAPRIPGRWKDKIPDPPAGFFDPLTDEELKDWYGDDA